MSESSSPLEITTSLYEKKNRISNISRNAAMLEY